MFKILSWLLFLLPTLALAQYWPDAKRDYTWIMGQTVPHNSGMGLDFHQAPPLPFLFPHDLNMYITNGVISDQDGHLLFFTNGMRVADRTGHIMPHGDSLCYGNMFDWMEPQYSGLAHSGLVILPLPGSDSIFYIINQKIEWDSIGRVISPALYFSIVDIRLNGTLGDVTEKDVLLIDDTLAVNTLAAVRHGNGRDWWIIVAEYYQSNYYRILLSTSGIQLVGKQSIGPNTTNYEVGNAVFSPDGNTFARGSDSTVLPTSNRLNIFSFNRCTGLLSNFRDASSMEPGSNSVEIAISPNSRYLYFSRAQKVIQYDLWSDDILNTKIIVGLYDGYTYGGNPTAFTAIELAPDGLVYIQNGYSPFMSPIESPDVAGWGCYLLQRGFQLPKINDMGLPVLPNFRLGRWEGSDCDTLFAWFGVQEQQTFQRIKIQALPNPASSDLRFELDVMNNKSEMQLVILDILGHPIDQIPVAPFQGLIRYSVRGLPDGVYFALLKGNGHLLTNCKFIVQH